MTLKVTKGEKCHPKIATHLCLNKMLKGACQGLTFHSFVLLNATRFNGEVYVSGLNRSEGYPIPLFADSEGQRPGTAGAVSAATAGPAAGLSPLVSRDSIEPIRPCCDGGSNVLSGMAALWQGIWVWV